MFRDEVARLVKHPLGRFLMKKVRHLLKSINKIPKILIFLILFIILMGVENYYLEPQMVTFEQTGIECQKTEISQEVECIFSTYQENELIRTETILGIQRAKVNEFECTFVSSGSSSSSQVETTTLICTDLVLETTHGDIKPPSIANVKDVANKINDLVDGKIDSFTYEPRVAIQSVEYPADPVIDGKIDSFTQEPEASETIEKPTDPVMVWFFIAMVIVVIGIFIVFSKPHEKDDTEEKVNSA